MSLWVSSKDGDSLCYAMYRRHYSSSKNKSPKQRQFVGPGFKMVLMGMLCDALFVWRKASFRQDGQIGVNCAVFRNESHNLSSDMIREACEWAWDEWPGERLFTMVNPKRVASKNPGYCFLKSGWRRCGTTAKGLLIFELLPTLPATPVDAQTPPG